jgi:isoquinoline 1-oxidoreductase alpha subunit
MVVLMTSLKINGRTHRVDTDPNTPLLWVLRDIIGLTGTRYGCGVGACGACSVLVNGQLTRSCLTPVGGFEGASITTIEGLSSTGDHPVQRAWSEVDVPQCGYCQSGMIMAAVALLSENPQPSDDDIDRAMTNICRCGTYGRIREAVHKAAKG